MFKLTVNKNIIKILKGCFMMTAKSKRQIRNDSKHHHPQSSSKEPTAASKNALKKLSFSFYGDDTLKKGKQIIFDNCELLQELPLLSEPALQRPNRIQRASYGGLKMCQSKKKNSMLQMENYFFEQKCGQIELVPTNASHVDCRSREGSLTKLKLPSRPGTSKTKKGGVQLQFQRRNCETVMGRKGECKTSRRCSRKRPTVK